MFRLLSSMQQLKEHGTVRRSINGVKDPVKYSDIASDSELKSTFDTYRPGHEFLPIVQQLRQAQKVPCFYSCSKMQQDVLFLIAQRNFGDLRRLDHSAEALRFPKVVNLAPRLHCLYMNTCCSHKLTFL